MTIGMHASSTRQSSDGWQWSTAWASGWSPYSSVKGATIEGDDPWMAGADPWSTGAEQRGTSSKVSLPARQASSNLWSDFSPVGGSSTSSTSLGRAATSVAGMRFASSQAGSSMHGTPAHGTASFSTGWTPSSSSSALSLGETTW